MYKRSAMRATRLRRRNLGRAMPECEHAAPPYGCHYVVTAANPCGQLTCDQPPAPVVTTNPIPQPLPPAVDTLPATIYIATPQGVLHPIYVTPQIPVDLAPPTVTTTPAAVSSPAVATAATGTAASSLSTMLASIPLWGWAVGIGGAALFFGKRR